MEYRVSVHAAVTPHRIKNRKKISGLLIVALSWLAVPGWGAEADGAVSPAVEVVKQTTRQLLDAVARDRDRIEQHPARAYELVERFIIPHVDLARISRLILGKHWRAASASQRQRFVNAFETMLVRTYATAVTEYTGSGIIYLPPRLHRNGREVTVRTEVPQPNGPPIALAYRMRRTNEEWKVVDMVIEGISLVATYRNSFGVQIRRVGLDRLIDDMFEKNRRT